MKKKAAAIAYRNRTDRHVFYALISTSHSIGRLNVGVTRSNLRLSFAARALATGFAFLALSLAVAPGIAGATSEPIPAPSATTPAWFSTAEGAAYSPASYPNPFTWTTGSDSKEYLKVSYWGPGGRGPTNGQPDVMLSAVSGDSEQAIVVMSQSQFSKDITLLTDGFAVPGSNEAQRSVEVHFDGFGDLTLSRPSMPGDCSVDDPTSYTGIPVVALGQDQRKYQLTIDVTFAERTVQCANVATSVPANSSQPSPLSIGTEQGTPTAYAPPPPTPGPTPLTDAVRFLILAGLAIAGLALFFRWRTSPVFPAYLTNPPVAEYGSDEFPGATDHHGRHPVGPPFLEWVRG